MIDDKQKFRRDVLWNILSFGAMAISGIALNALILAKYGPATLGAFNQVYAIYIFLSQFAVLGLYAPVLKFISQYSEDKKTCDEIFTSAIILGVLAASLATFVFWILSPWAGRLLDSRDVAKGLVFAIIGLWCFSLNKIFLAFLNGKRQMKAFAIFNTIRFLMLPASLVVLILLKLPGYVTPLVFSITESFLLIGLFFFSIRLFSFATFSQCRRWFLVHLPFGAKSLIGGGVSEINTRIDVLMLGAFFSDKIVGIYSFAAMLAEGLDQIPSIFKVNFNPLITKIVISGRLQELKRTIRTFLKKWMPAAFLIGVLAVLVYPLAAKIISNDPELLAGRIVFAILLAGIVIKSGYAVFWELPTQSGFPGYQTALIITVSLSNIIMNSLMIPLWGMYGAAIATALSFIFGVFYLKFIVKKTIGVII